MAIINYNTLIVGMPGTGKTTIALNVEKKSKKGVLIIDQDINEAYNHFETTSLLDVLKTPIQSHQRVRLIIDSDEMFREAIILLLKHQQNLHVFLEDCKNYISQNIQKEVGLLLRNFRKKNFDVYYMYHALKFIPPEVATMADCLILFQTNEDVSLSLLKNKFGKASDVMAMHQLINKPNTPLHTSKSMYLTIKKN